MDTSKFPVENVTWFDCVGFCNRLSDREGLPPYYELTVTKQNGKSIEDAEVKILSGTGYHIPTDAEWEHGCRAGTRTKYYCGDQDEELPEYAWFKENSKERTHPVGEKKPNAFGLYDMHGNVQEWNEEMLTNATTGVPERVARGGCRIDGAGYYCAVSTRPRYVPATRNSVLGLRVSRVP
jgi:formylglycine-generating enzyme required for sulfatase activity